MSEFRILPRSASGLSSLSGRPFPTRRSIRVSSSVSTGELKALGIQLEDDLFFICRSGSRSLAAAKAMAAAGYRNCHNVGGGFEGPLDDERHRGALEGWKAAGLPWQQG